MLIHKTCALKSAVGANFVTCDEHVAFRKEYVVYLHLQILVLSIYKTSLGSCQLYINKTKISLTTNLTLHSCKVLANDM